jgi:DNA-binding transcriptional LysR family regulator
MLEPRELDRIRKRVRLRDLETLLAVVDAGRMRRAAEHLHLSQPAVSKAIRELESALGVPLFERSKSGVKATAYGLALVRRAKTVFDELRLGLRDLEHLADPRGGVVQLGCMETLNAGLIGVAIERVARQYPQMLFRVQSGESPDLIGHHLAERVCEFVVARPYQLPLPADMTGEPLYTDRVRVVVGATSPFARRRKVRIEELAGESWILSTNEVQAASPIAEAFEAVGLPMPRIRMVTGSLNIRQKLVPTGRFVTVMPHSLLHFVARRPELKVLPIELPAWHTPTMILTLRNRTLGPAANIMMDEIRTLAREVK